VIAYKKSLEIVHRYMYNEVMKKKALEKRLKKCGWWLDRHGSNHDIWTNGKVAEPVPRHPEVNERISRKILQKAENNPGEG